MRQNARMVLRVSNGSGAPAQIEVRENSPFGPVLGCVRVGDTGGWDRFEEVPCRLENTYGTHSLCFVFRGEAGEVLRFEDFRFERVAP